MTSCVSQVQVKNYKSLAEVTVNLEPLTVFVGPNGSGKSNFIDALAFVQECLAGSIELALQNRGGIGAVRRKSGGHPTHIGIRLIMNLAGDVADYSFEIAARPDKGFGVARERCVVDPFMKGNGHHEFQTQEGEFTKPILGIRPRVSPDRLALYAASATEEFRPVYDFLTSMRFYSISPQRLRDLQDPDPGEILKRDGENAAAVLKRLTQETPDRYERLCRLLAKVVDGVNRVRYQAIGQKETLQFKQDVGLKDPWTFEALNMSDGTLRLLGLLLAVFQPGPLGILAIEEPEATVHPAAAELVMDVLSNASKDRQVLVATHSPDLLDFKNLAIGQIRAVTRRRGKTLIAPVDSVSKKAIQDRLYTPGELLRAGELAPDEEAAQQAMQQLDLFGPTPAGVAEEQ